MANPNTTKLKPTHNTFSNNEKATRCVLMDGFGVTTVLFYVPGWLRQEFAVATPALIHFGPF
nr:hypothetical protein [Lactiplantibacillus plantarum]